MARKLESRAVFLTTLLVMSTVFLGNFALVKASPETIVYVDPPEVKDIFAPDQFTIYVKVLNVIDFYGLDIQFTWDPTIIKYVSHQKHIPVETYPDGILHQPTIPVKNQVDETASMPGSEPGTRYWLAEASMLPAAPFDGNGVIFEMKFEVVGLGTSELRIVACTLSDSDGNPIPITLQHGIFQNYVPPTPPPANIFVDPATVINSSLVPCSNFDVFVNVSDVENLYAFDFWLDYNATLLEIVSVSVNPVFPSPTIVDDPGQLGVSDSLEPPDPPIAGELYLALIEFHVLDMGESDLDLHDVVLLDDEGEPIVFNEPEDGYFNNMEFFMIPATVEIEPNALNLKSVGKWIAAYIELPEGYDVGDIDVSTVSLGGTVPADLGSAVIGDFDSDGIPDLMVRFDRAEVIEYIVDEGFVCGEVELTVSGELTGVAILFEGSDIVTVSSLIGDANCDGVVNISDIVLGGLAYDSSEEDPAWNANANFAPSYELIDILDLVTAAAHYGEKCP